jgi:hypothetical protein
VVEAIRKEQNLRVRRLITKGKRKVEEQLPSLQMKDAHCDYVITETRDIKTEPRKQIKTHLNDELACRSSSVLLLSCVGVPGFDDFFFKADFNGTALNFGSLAGISSMRDVSIL